MTRGGSRGLHRKHFLPFIQIFVLYHIFTRFLNSAHKLEIPRSEVRDLLRQWLEEPTATHFLLIEPDEELRRILDETFAA